MPQQRSQLLPCALALALLHVVAPVHAQATNPLVQARPLVPGPSRWLEDYRFLKDPSKRTDPFDGLRYHELSDSSWLQLGGEARYASFSIDHPDFDLTPARSDNYLQQRAQLHASLHLMDNAVRAFVQVQNTRSWNQKTLTRRDDTRLDVAQAFLDTNFNLGAFKTTARIGRQELSYGTAAMVNIGEPRNIRLAFQGARVMLNSSAAKVEVFAVRPIVANFESFDDRTDKNVKFYGVYATIPVKPRIGVDLYVFGHERKRRVFQSFTGSEERNTFGTRLFGQAGQLDWNWDMMVQRGEHAGRDIRAWALTGDAGYTFASAAKVRVGMYFDRASGGKPTSATITRTFDPLYPRNGMYGEAAVNTLANMTMFGPSLAFSPTPTTRISSSIMKFARTSTDDYVYLPNLRPLAATLNNADDDIGTNYQVSAVWQPNRNLNFEVSLMNYQAGSAVLKAGGRDVRAAVVRAGMRF